jgi:hypothetical protein
LLAGTDSGGVPYLYHGSRLHDELALLVDGGITARNTKVFVQSTRHESEALLARSPARFRA